MIYKERERKNVVKKIIERIKQLDSEDWGTIIPVAMFIGLIGFLLTCVIFDINLCNKDVKAVEKILIGEHELRRITTIHEKEGKITGSFFIFGSLQGSMKQNLEVYFSWKMNDGKTYTISKLPIQKIRVQTQEGLEIPTIKFRWKQGTETNLITIFNGDEFYYSYIYYAIITCSPEDWTPNINMPLSAKD